MTKNSIVVFGAAFGFVLCYIVGSIASAPAPSQPTKRATRYRSDSLNRLVAASEKTLARPATRPEDDDETLDAVYLFFDLRRADLLAESMSRSTLNARGLAMELARELPCDLQAKLLIATLSESTVFRRNRLSGEQNAVYITFIHRYSMMVQAVCSAKGIEVWLDDTFFDDAARREHVRQQISAKE